MKNIYKIMLASITLVSTLFAAEKPLNYRISLDSINLVKEKRFDDLKVVLECKNITSDLTKKQRDVSDDSSYKTQIEKDKIFGDYLCDNKNDNIVLSTNQLIDKVNAYSDSNNIYLKDSIYTSSIKSNKKFFNQALTSKDFSDNIKNIELELNLNYSTIALNIVEMPKNHYVKFDIFADVDTGFWSLSEEIFKKESQVTDFQYDFYKMRIKNISFKKDLSLPITYYTNTYDMNTSKECIDGRVWVKASSSKKEVQYKDENGSYVTALADIKTERQVTDDKCDWMKKGKKYDKKEYSFSFKLSL